MISCPKHYALNSIENSRWFVDVKIKERALREVYLPHFKKVVTEGKTPSLMTAYNSVNGYYMSENKYLLHAQMNSINCIIGKYITNYQF